MFYGGWATSNCGDTTKKSVVFKCFYKPNNEYEKPLAKVNISLARAKLSFNNIIAEQFPAMLYICIFNGTTTAIVAPGGRGPSKRDLGGVPLGGLLTISRSLLLLPCGWFAPNCILLNSKLFTRVRETNKQTSGIIQSTELKCELFAKKEKIMKNGLSGCLAAARWQSGGGQALTFTAQWNLLIFTPAAAFCSSINIHLELSCSACKLGVATMFALSNDTFHKKCLGLKAYQWNTPNNWCTFIEMLSENTSLSIYLSIYKEHIRM